MTFSLSYEQLTRFAEKRIRECNLDSQGVTEKTDIIAPVFTEQTTESVSAGINSSAVEKHIPEAPARKKKKKKHRFPRPSHWTREYTHECVEKIKILFPHLRAEGGGFIPLKIGINNDISAFLAEYPEAELTMDEWLCAVSCITSRRVYLQRTAVAGVPRYGLDGHPKGQVSESEAQSAGRRLATLEQKWLRMQGPKFPLCEITHLLQNNDLSN
nr:ProQ/FINO family protein [Escherichia coli]